ncbi:unnamed protein product [Onchocerca flexuosa]|uniref:Uncharacterized protein n=1 Tax=Onchocerca flexuosa TaxID=387005 RepID=A0A183I0X8_9BILA|nr:unnamed protein product [Onchocerca flexuosa]
MLNSWLKQESPNVYAYLEVAKIFDREEVSETVFDDYDFFLISQLLQLVIVMTVTIRLIAMCGLRKSERKDLTKASTIVSMPEVRKFKLDLSEETQKELDVDLDAALDNIGKETPTTGNAAPEVITQTNGAVKNFAESVFSEVLQDIIETKKTKQKNEECKENEKEESRQTGLKKQGKSKKSIHSQLGSRITKGLEEKQWKQPIGSNEVLF